MAEFVGNTPGNVAMDQEQLRTAYYTPAEANEQIARAAADAGAQGQKLLGGVDAFIAGINQAQHDLCPIIGGADLPRGVRRAAEDADRLDPRRHRLHRLARRRHLRQGRRPRDPEREVVAGAQGAVRQAGRRCGSTATSARRTTRRRPRPPARARRTTARRSTRTCPASRSPTATPPPPPAPARRCVALPPLPHPGPCSRSWTCPTASPSTCPELGAHGMSNALLVTGQEVEHRQAAGSDGPADRLLRAAAAGRAGPQRPGHPGPRRRLRRHQPLRPARPRSRLRLVGHVGRQRQHRHRGREAVQHRRHQADAELDGLPGRQEVRPDAVRRALRDHHAEPHRAGPRHDVQVPGAAHPARHRPAADHGRRQARSRWSPSGRRTATRSTRCSASASSTTRLRAQREDLPEGRERHRLHVQLVLRRLQGHLLLLLRAAAEAVEEGRAGPAALGRQEVRLEGLAAVQEARARDQPEARLPGQLEQQAGARLLGGRRHVELRRGLPLAGAREAADGQDQGHEEDRPARHGRRDGRWRHR